MSVVVLKVGGASTGGIAEAVAELRALGHSVCVVHGAGPQISAGDGAARARACEFVGGRRVTTPRGARGRARELRRGQRGRLRGDRPDARRRSPATRSASRRSRSRSSGSSASRCRRARRRRRRARARASSRSSSPLARGPLNVNADELASALAVGLGAARIHFLTDVPGVFHDGWLVRSIRAGRAESLVGDGTFEGGIVPKLLAAARAARSGARRRDRRHGGGRVSTVARERAAADVSARRGSRSSRATASWLDRRMRAGATSTSPPGSPSSALGHRHPAPLAAAHAQLDRLWHASNLYGTRAGAPSSRGGCRIASAARRRSSATPAPRRTRPR